MAKVKNFNINLNCLQLKVIHGRQKNIIYTFLNTTKQEEISIVMLQKP